MKHDISMHPFWSHDEFMAYLLLYAANADMECTDEERQMIVDWIPEGHLPEVEKEYNRLTDYERISLIQIYKTKHYPTSGEKKEIIDMIKKLCKADGRYDIMEKNMVMMLKRVL